MRRTVRVRIRYTREPDGTVNYLDARRVSEPETPVKQVVMTTSSQDEPEQTASEDHDD